MMRLPFRPHAPALAAALLLLSACSSLGDLVSGDRIDYRSAAKRTQTLDVPPDLTQLAREGRFNPQSGAVTASSYASGSAAAAGSAGTASPVAPQAVGDVRMQRAGQQRWLVTDQKAEQLWPKLAEFWQGLGFTLAVNAPESGVIETDWAENRAKLPQDIVRATLGKVIDSLYSTGERDKFRARIERTATGTEIYLSHRGLEEVYTSESKERTIWQARANDPQLEAEMLSRLMVYLGKKPEEAQAQVAATATSAAASATPARAKLGEAKDSTELQVDEGFDRAWRRVGLALDRRGFTVEDRDRSGGIYFVRYIDPQRDIGEKPGLLTRLFSSEPKPADAVRYRVSVKGEASGSSVRVLDAQGAVDASPTARRIAALLVEELK
jgi:outer membrane protein assembly factor BamC